MFLVQVIEKWIYESILQRTGTPPTQAHITVIWSIIVSIFCVGGMIGGAITGTFSNKLNSPLLLKTFRSRNRCGQIWKKRCSPPQQHLRRTRDNISRVLQVLRLLRAHHLGAVVHRNQFGTECRTGTDVFSRDLPDQSPWSCRDGLPTRHYHFNSCRSDPRTTVGARIGHCLAYAFGHYNRTSHLSGRQPLLSLKEILKLMSFRPSW